MPLSESSRVQSATELILWEKQCRLRTWPSSQHCSLCCGVSRCNHAQEWQSIAPATSFLGNAQATPQLVRDSQVEGGVAKYLSGLEAQPAFQAALQRSLAGLQPSDIVDCLQEDQARQKVRNMLAVLLASHVRRQAHSHEA